MSSPRLSTVGRQAGSQNFEHYCFLFCFVVCVDDRAFDDSRRRLGKWKRSKREGACSVFVYTAAPYAQQPHGHPASLRFGCGRWRPTLPPTLFFFLCCWVDGFLLVWTEANSFPGREVHAGYSHQPSFPLPLLFSVGSLLLRVRASREGCGHLALDHTQFSN